jgi:hypothetical protein
VSFNVIPSPFVQACAAGLAFAKAGYTRGVPLQNRVTPFGEIVALSQRGLFMGNRGIIHDPATRTLLTRRWTNKAWIICRCDFRGVRRKVMSRRSWTELFFLDEATALSAGHRPCYYCRRESALSFATAWARAQGLQRVSAAQIDSRLHAERLHDGAKRVHPLHEASDLPNGAMVALSGEAYLMWHGRAHRWQDSGYAPPCDLQRTDGLLTPPSTVAALRAGYVCAAHSSLSDFFPRLQSPTRK